MPAVGDTWRRPAASRQRLQQAPWPGAVCQGCVADRSVCGWWCWCGWWPMPVGTCRLRDCGVGRVDIGGCPGRLQWHGQQVWAAAGGASHRCAVVVTRRPGVVRLAMVQLGSTICFFSTQCMLRVAGLVHKQLVGWRTPSWGAWQQLHADRAARLVPSNRCARLCVSPVCGTGASLVTPGRQRPLCSCVTFMRSAVVVCMSGVSGETRRVGV